jgi:hypothetical protein
LEWKIYPFGRGIYFNPKDRIGAPLWRDYLTFEVIVDQPRRSEVYNFPAAAGSLRQVDFEIIITDGVVAVIRLRAMLGYDTKHLSDLASHLPEAVAFA